MLRNATLALLSLIIVFFILEAIFRFIEPKSPPGTTYGHPVSLNSDGFRDREFEIPKPQGTYRILALGDSMSWGVGMDLEDTFLKLTEKKLRTKFSNIEIVNAAHRGDNTTLQLETLKASGLKYEPDLIVLTYFLNDVRFTPVLGQTRPVIQDPASSKYIKKRNRARVFVHWLRDQSKFLAFVISRTIHFLKMCGFLKASQYSWMETLYQGFTDENPGWLKSKKALAEIKQLCDARGIKMVIVIHPILFQLNQYGGRQAHAAIANYAKQIGVEAIDLLPVFENKDARKLWVNFADSHPNQKANQLVADYLIPRLEAAIAA